MRILFTGASSFTGYWFVQTLARRGHSLVCAPAGNPDLYTGVRQQRWARLTNPIHTVASAPFGSEAFLNLLQKGGPWDLLCHHAADTSNYRSPDFDAVGALTRNTLNIQAVLQTLKKQACRGIVLTGSVFEFDEAAGNEPLRAFSPYGLSKGLTWQVFRYYCDRMGMPLGKFVIPNPFGPFEEERFTAYLMRQWREAKVPSVKTPDYVRDNIPVDLLAKVYAQFTERVARSDEPLSRCNPSGFAETQGEFTHRVAREVRARTGWDCDVALEKQQDFAEPLRRVNTKPATVQVPDWNEGAFWDAFVAFYVPAAAT